MVSVYSNSFCVVQKNKMCCFDLSIGQFSHAHTQRKEVEEELELNPPSFWTVGWRMTYLSQVTIVNRNLWWQLVLTGGGSGNRIRSNLLFRGLHTLLLIAEWFSVEFVFREHKFLNINLFVLININDA